MTEINAHSEGHSKQVVIGENKGVVNTGDTYEVQREVLALDIERWRPERDPAQWVERTHPQTELQQRIEDGSEHLVEVLAAGGFGKSLLADWAYEHTQAQFGKALWLNCSNAPSFNTVSRYILQEVGFLIREDATPDKRLVKELAFRLTEKSALVVIDQLEAVTTREDWPSFQAFLAQWQAHGTHSMLILTTRVPVLTTGQHRLELGGFSPNEGATYLSQQGIVAERADLEALAELGQGHPLLLKFSASWLQETAAARLETSDLSFFERLFQQSRDDTALSEQLTTPESQVDQVFRLLLARLVPQRRELLLAVSVYRKPFAMAQAQAMDVQATAADLAALTGRGFLTVQGACWTLHPLVKTLVNTELQAAGQAVAAHQKAVAYFAGQLQAEQIAIGDVLECFYHHYQLQDYSAAYDVVAPATDWLDRQGFYQLLVSLYGQLVTAWQDASPATTEAQQRFANSLGNLGNAYFSLGEYPRAIEFHQQYYEIAQAIGDRLGEANSLGNLGNAYFSLGEYPRAIEFHQQYYEIAQAIGDRLGEANSLGNLGNAYFSLGEYPRAIEFHQQSLEIKRAIGDRRGEANSLGNLGIAYNSLGDYPRAIEFHQQSLKIQRAIGDRRGEANSLSSLGNTYDSLGDYPRAIEFHQQSLKIQRAIGDRRGEAYSLGNLGNAYDSLGDYPRAIEFHQQHYERSRAIGDRLGEANSLGNLGNAYDSLGDYPRAIKFHKQYYEIAGAIGDRRGEANSLGNLGLAYRSLGEYPRAIECHEQSLEISRAIGDRRGEANSLGNLGSAYDSLGEYPRAIEFHEQSLEIKRAIGDRRGEANSLGNLGNAYDSLGDYPQAIRFYEQSLEIDRAIGDRNGQATSLFNCASARARVDDYWIARQNLEQARELFVELQLNHRIEQCDTMVRELEQMIAAQPRQALIIDSPEPTTRDDDWYPKSLPTHESSSPAGENGNQWLFYVVIVIVVVVLIVILQ
ncbi:MAG: tetratricopeptide repeat protein [Leptolyngbya sp. SIO1D8]|nr:tetratricopeptide repeat protein [Leptolyngbya sp. SIO1D8]